MKLDTDLNLPRMAGFGAAAWGDDTQKMSMHPPIPGHIEFVEEEMQSHAEHHHIVQRRHPQNDEDKSLVRKEITPEDMGCHPQHVYHLMHRHQLDKKHSLTVVKNYKAYAAARIQNKQHQRDNHS